MRGEHRGRMCLLAVESVTTFKECYWPVPVGHTPPARVPGGAAWCQEGSPTAGDGRDPVQTLGEMPEVLCY